jgi:hypothetical protein
MTNTYPELQALKDSVRADAKQRYARWDDGAFEQALSWPALYLWRRLQKRPARERDRSILTYLHAVASGVGAGYITVADGASRTLMQALLCDRMPGWLADTPPESHAKITATAWNLAEGARREAAWMEQYLLARVDEFDDPAALEQKAVELLKPVLEKPRNAAWKGPFMVTIVHPEQQVQDFLPGEISMVTPSLIRVADRRHKRGVGVLLERGSPECIGRMDGVPTDTAPAPEIPVTWGGDYVAISNTIVPLPLMACAPLHSLALANGYLIAVVQNSQRLWVVETP